MKVLILNEERVLDEQGNDTFKREIVSHEEKEISTYNTLAISSMLSSIASRDLGKGLHRISRNSFKALRKALKRENLIDENEILKTI